MVLPVVLLHRVGALLAAERRPLTSTPPLMRVRCLCGVCAVSVRCVCVVCVRCVSVAQVGHVGSARKLSVGDSHLDLRRVPYGLYGGT